MKLTKEEREVFRKLGRLGGQSKSEKKRAAVRKNGKLGGYPGKKKKK